MSTHALEIVARYWYCMYESELMPLGVEDPAAYREEAEKLREKLKRMGVDPRKNMPKFLRKGAAERRTKR